MNNDLETKDMEGLYKFHSTQNLANDALFEHVIVCILTKILAWKCFQQMDDAREGAVMSGYLVLRKLMETRVSNG